MDKRQIDRGIVGHDELHQISVLIISPLHEPAAFQLCLEFVDGVTQALTPQKQIVKGSSLERTDDTIPSSGSDGQSSTSAHCSLPPSSPPDFCPSYRVYPSGTITVFDFVHVLPVQHNCGISYLLLPPILTQHPFQPSSQITFPSPSSTCLWQAVFLLAEQLLEPRLRDYLQNQLQVGYILWVYSSLIQQLPVFVILVQSATHTPIQLHGYMEKILHDLEVCYSYSFKYYVFCYSSLSLSFL